MAMVRCPKCLVLFARSSWTGACPTCDLKKAGETIDEMHERAGDYSVTSYMTGLPTDDRARKAVPIWTFLMEYFPDTFLALVGVAVRGNEQHNPGEPLHWAREKSTDQMNTAFRHMFDYGRGVKKDTDGQWHLAKAIWRLSAQLQLDIEADRQGLARCDEKFRAFWDSPAPHDAATFGEALQQETADDVWLAPSVREPILPPFAFCGDCGNRIDLPAESFCLYKHRHYLA